MRFWLGVGCAAVGVYVLLVPRPAWYWYCLATALIVAAVKLFRSTINKNEN